MRKQVSSIIAIILLLLAGAGFLFVKYAQQKIAVYYAEKESKLYRYYYDYYYAHNKRFSATEFLKVLSRKDPELYELLKNGKIAYYPKEEGFAYQRYASSQNFVSFEDFTFAKFLFSDANIAIDPIMSLSKIDYETDVVYQYKNDSFIEKELFNKRLLIDKYTQLLHCKKPFLEEDCLSSDYNLCKEATAVIFPKEVVLVKSSFEPESEAIIKQVLQTHYTNTNDTLMVVVNFPNLSEAKCLNIRISIDH